MDKTRHQVEQEALEAKRAAAKAARVTTDPATAMEGAPAWDVDPAADTDFLSGIAEPVQVDCSAAARVGANIKALREKAGLSRQSIGIKGLPAIEKGAANPILTTLEKIAAGLGVDVVDLLKED